MEERPWTYYEICGLNAQPGSDECIFHCASPNKDKVAFAEVLEAHRQEKGDMFPKSIFPYPADFRGAWFSQKANFGGATSRRTDLTNLIPYGITKDIDALLGSSVYLECYDLSACCIFPCVSGNCLVSQLLTH